MSHLSTKVFVDWLEARHKEELDYALVFRLGRIPDSPNRACSVTRSSAPRLINGGLFEEIVYRVQTRGASNNHENAEQIAYDIDKLLDNQTMFDIEDIYVLSIVCTARPRLLNITDPESRYNFTADYKVTASID